MSHTAEPWSLHIEDGDFNIKDSNGFYVAAAVPSPGRGDESAADNASRIVACVNACKGISTETLENVPDNVFIYAQDMTKNRDDWKARYEFSVGRRSALAKELESQKEKLLVARNALLSAEASFNRVRNFTRSEAMAIDCLKAAISAIGES